MAQPTNNGNIVKRTSQYLDNIEHDDATQAKGVAIYGTPDGNNIYRLAINPDGSISTSTSSQNFDYVGLAQASLTDTYTFKTGGVSGTTVKTITITYTDASKATMQKVEYS